MTYLWILIITALLVIAAGLAERLLHRQNLRGIPIRVHVNGTRGMSSVTRLIAAGLNEGAIRTCAKTTGTPAPGQGEIFHREDYNRWLAAGALAILLAAVFAFVRSEVGPRLLQSQPRSKDDYRHEPMV